MRFSAANYEKAFPRQNKAASAPAPAHGNVIEEAENVGKKDPEPAHGNVIEEAPEEIPEEGAAGGADDSE